MPSRDSERQAFPDDSFEIFEIRGPGNLCGGDFGCETLSRACGLVGGGTFARRGREITLRSLTCEKNLIYLSTDFTCLLVKIGDDGG